ncbi:ABC transporter permease [Lentilactobacillus parafarraginis]|uniref:Spermidine putrescine ABC superfamily ATP binding cassette transporter, permease protein n=3 Tax=Lentilactobacillus parafarraginis TaxID=390842 RepID=A0A0R1YNJ8_9LACO|nr:ABC transporter permease [Lentilactobacillus parafarraginis]KRM43674.1 spermidine putrescine ABC superfamily ATP binding cassette transporter, permease protein [Lentilactobacillus parafarraginis DSM 18390 = JCM 14109]TLQ18583.1 ABC transporter permease [Lentilactobacillus parafarraginis]
MSNQSSKLGKLYIIIVFALLYIPIIYLIVYSFSSGTTMANFNGFSLTHYGELFHDNRLLAIFLNTILIALLSSVFSTIIGTLGALGVHNAKKRHSRQTLLSLNSILLVSPDVIMGASFLIFFTSLKVPLGFWSVLLSHIAFEIPIVVLMVLPRLDEMSPSLINAATDLGATAGQVLSRVILPFIQPGIIAGFFMAITYSLDDFAVTFFVTGNGFTTLSVEIYSRARQGISLEINALAGIMFIFSLILVIVYYFIENHDQSTRRKKDKLEVTK